MLCVFLTYIYITLKIVILWGWKFEELPYHVQYMRIHCQINNLFSRNVCSVTLSNPSFKKIYFTNGMHVNEIDITFALS